MEITIIGWYGTETIGDRAILAGIFRVFSKAYGRFKVRLGSLYPFYTERTMYEDAEFYELASCNRNLEIVLFNSLNPRELALNIRETDLLVVGGGPLMDLYEMNMLNYSFHLAKKYGIKSVILGCGWGPLSTSQAKRISCDMVSMSALTIFRDLKSKEEYLKIAQDINPNVHNLIDPAFIACEVYKENFRKERTEDHISVNFRDVSLEGTHYFSDSLPEDVFVRIVDDLSRQSQLPIHLIPMHNFYIGGDDRIILNRIKRALDNKNVVVQQTPLSLCQTMDSYYNAAFCVGMRFHSVVLQTVLNGNNFIVDYTDPVSGKIVGMMKDMGMMESYSERYYSLHTSSDVPKFDLTECKRFVVDSTRSMQYLDKYVALLSSL